MDDPPVHTSGGMFAVTDLSLHLLALDLGQAYANDVGRLLVGPPRRSGGQAQFVKDAIRLDHEAPLGSLPHWLRDNIREPVTLARLARRENISERSLVRKFRESTGHSVLDWINRERADQAKALLETTDFRISEIAAMVGFGSTETLRRNFEKVAGTIPTGYRATFRPVAAEAGRSAQGTTEST